MWTYAQKTGEIYRDGTTMGVGYAGFLEGKNNPDMQNVPNTGPLPQGNYLVGGPVEDPETGPYTLPLIPDPANEMFGRSAFKIHGDSLSHPGQASHGCIVTNRPLRMAIWESADFMLQVVSGE
jgi:hypothetical protein